MRRSAWSSPSPPPRAARLPGLNRRNRNLTLPTPEGGTLWVEVYRNGWNTYYRLHIIEEQPLKKVLTFGAAQIRSELETKGEVTLHGVHFDFNQATLRPESGKVLVEAARVLQALPEMRVEIQGHTCDIGGRAYNLKLSQARAETVKNFLVQQGIAPDRLVPRGYGMDQPVASNDTEEGRAQNRRVVFKRL
ncbi:MAG: OmpA family protein [Syntrophobacterales bacterium]|nr:OmpA family protein [Syntrophobacterales bacterium]